MKKRGTEAPKLKKQAPKTKQKTKAPKIKKQEPISKKARPQN